MKPTFCQQWKAWLLSEPVMTPPNGLGQLRKLKAVPVHPEPTAAEVSHALAGIEGAKGAA